MGVSIILIAISSLIAPSPRLVWNAPAPARPSGSTGSSRQMRRRSVIFSP
jgi:hypothetical protein